MMMVVYISWDMKKETIPYMGTQKKFYPPINKQTYDRRTGKVGFNQIEVGNLSGIQMGPLHRKIYGTRKKLDFSLVK